MNSPRCLTSNFELDNVSATLNISPVRKTNTVIKNSESGILNLYNLNSEIPKSNENDLSLHSINLNNNYHHRVNTNLTNYLYPSTDYSIQINDEYIRPKSEILSSNKYTNHNDLNSEYLINSIQNLGNLMKNTRSINQKFLNDPVNKKKVDNLKKLLNKSNENYNLESNININNNSRYSEVNNEQEKERVVQEIFISSDERLKKYDVLFDFIQENIQGMAEIVSLHGSSKKSKNNSGSVSHKNKTPKPEDFNPKIRKDFLNSDVVHIKNKSHFSSSESVCSDNWVDEEEKENLDQFDPQTLTSFRSRTNLSHSLSQNEIKNDLNCLRSKTCESLILNNDNQIIIIEPNKSTQNERNPKKVFLQNKLTENENLKIGVLKNLLEANSDVFIDCSDVLLEYHNSKTLSLYDFLFNELDEQSKKYKDLKYVQGELEEEKNLIYSMKKSNLEDINERERIEFLFLRILKSYLNKLNVKLESYNYKKSKKIKEKIESAVWKFKSC
jgi:hypothetical protein